MTLTVRLDPALEKKMGEEARRRGLTKSELVRDALEKALGLEDPVKRLAATRSRKPMRNPAASDNVSEKMRAKLRASRPD